MLSAKSDAIGLLDKAFFPTFFYLELDRKKKEKSQECIVKSGQIQ